MKPYLLAIMAVLFATLSVLPARAATFTDVPEQHWAKDTIARAVEQGIVQGYPGNRFAPEEHVTVAAFFTMLARTYHIQIPPSQKQALHWADPIYDALAPYHYPYSTLQQQYLSRFERNQYLYRDRPITRYEVAEIIAGADGENYHGDFAVHYLLAKGYASGKAAGQASIQSYQGQSYLTRAEAVAFLEKLKSSGLKQLKVRPQQPSDPQKLPALSGQQFADPKEEKLYTVLFQHPGYFVERYQPGVNSMFRTIQREITPTEQDGDDTQAVLYVHFDDTSELGPDFHGFKNEQDQRLAGLTKIDINDVQNQTAVQIAMDVLRQFGIEPPPQLPATISEMKQGPEDKVLSHNKVRFVITYRQHNSLSIAWQKE